MPKKLNWQFLYCESFANNSDFRNFADYKLSAITSKNNKINCTQCNNNDKHKMEYITLLCNNADCNLVDLCNVRYKVYHCMKKNKYKFFRLNDHEQPILPRVITSRKGITPVVKSLINSLIHDYDISIPKKLNKNYTTNIKIKSKMQSTSRCLL